MKTNLPDIFNYTDYRSYLNDVYTHFKNLDTKYSHRFIAKEIEASSPGWFSDILKGRINCAPRFIPRLAKVFRLTDDRKDYFELLVNYNQAGSIEEKEAFFKKMLSFTAAVKSTLVLLEKFSFYSKWYIPAIRELLFIYDFCDNYKELAQKMLPRISIKQAKEAIGILKTCQMIEKNTDGFYKPCDPILEKDDSTKSVLWATYMCENIALSKEAIYRLGKEERNISAVTIALSKDGYKIACEKIKELRKSLLQLSEVDKNKALIYQANFQFFPLSKLNDKD